MPVVAVSLTTAEYRAAKVAACTRNVTVEEWIADAVQARLRNPRVTGRQADKERDGRAHWALQRRVFERAHPGQPYVSRAEGITHGTKRGHSYFGCRCDPCRLAKSLSDQKRRNPEGWAARIAELGGGTVE